MIEISLQERIGLPHDAFGRCRSGVLRSNRWIHLEEQSDFTWIRSAPFIVNVVISSSRGKIQRFTNDDSSLKTRRVESRESERRM